MKKRVITSVGYVVVLIALLALKWLFPVYGSLGFDLLFWAISVCGAYEFLRAVKDVSGAQKCAAMATCILIIPAYVVSKMLYDLGYGNEYLPLTVLMTVSSVGAMVTAALLVFDFGKSTVFSTALAELCILYCGVLGCVGANINHLAENSLTAVMLMFFITAGVDTFAFLVGMALGRFLPLKLAPHTSPNKTVVGAVGGIIGGVFAACVAYLVCLYLPVSPFAPEGYEIFGYHGNIHPCVLLILISLPTSVFAQLGDLFESAIKRGCNIKDMGNLLPGHGGMLDRFDSMLFTAVSIVVCFIII